MTVGGKNFGKKTGKTQISDNILQEIPNFFQYLGKQITVPPRSKNPKSVVPPCIRH